MAQWKWRGIAHNITEAVFGRDLSIPKLLPFIRNLTEGVKLLLKYLERGLPITIVGDYDCDGVTSSSILYKGIKEFKPDHPVRVIIPDRYKDGYGLNMSIVDRIENGLMITIDNGIAAVDQIRAAKAKGLGTMIIDHHLIRDDGLVPEADVVIDPHIDDSEFKDYCGAGLAYRFICELNPDSKIQRQLVALAGLGTVADVMPLVNDNRRIVIEALDAVENREVTHGFEALLSAAGVKDHVTEETFGFTLGPCFNALGRMEEDGATRIFNLIVSDADMETLLPEAEYVVRVNDNRKVLVEQEMQLVNASLTETSPIIVFEDSTIFTKGTIGLVAGKLTEKYKCPSVVFTADKKKPENLTGSARAPEGVHLKDLLDKAKNIAATQYQTDLFVGYGGHAGAAGLTIPRDNLELFEDIMKELLKDYVPEADVFYYDIETGIDGLPALMGEVELYAPYGEGNPKPIVRVNDVCGVPKEIGKLKNHFMLQAVGVKITAFHLAEKWREEGCPKSMDVLGTLNIDHFGGNETLQLQAVDFQKTEEKKTDAFRELESMFSF